MTLPTVKLADKEVPVSWGNLAKIRYSSLSDEVTAPKGMQQVVVMLWCCIALKPNPYPTWEHLADDLDMDLLGEYSDTLTGLFPSVEKKSTSETGLSPESASV